MFSYWRGKIYAFCTISHYLYVLLNLKSIYKEEMNKKLQFVLYFKVENLDRSEV